MYRNAVDLGVFVKDGDTAIDFVAWYLSNQLGVDSSIVKNALDFGYCQEGEVFASHKSTKSGNKIVYVTFYRWLL